MRNRSIKPAGLVFWGFLLFTLALMNTPHFCSAASESSKPENTPQFGIAQDMGKVAKREAEKVRKDLEKRARSLFGREPMEWDIQTVQYLYDVTVSLPSRIPQATKSIIEESRVLGLLGSLLILLFVTVVLYSLLGQNRTIKWVEKKAEPALHFIPEAYYPYLLSLIKVLVSALIPLLLLGLFSLINQIIVYRATWFQVTGRLLVLWAVGAILLRLLREVVTGNLFAAAANHGRVIYRYARLILLYVIVGIAAYRVAEVFQIREDVLGLIRFCVSVSVSTIVFLLFLKKGMFISLLPELPYRGYRWVSGFIRNNYYLILGLSYLSALLWCFGYPKLGKLVLSKIWLTLGALLLITLGYYHLKEYLKRWSQKLRRRMIPPGSLSGPCRACCSTRYCYLRLSPS